MKRTILSIALTTILAACGSASDEQPAPATGVSFAAQQVEQQQPEAAGIKVETQSPYLDPVSEQTGVPYALPETEGEMKISNFHLKYLNTGVARAVAEYKMVGEVLKAELAVEMGGGVDAWIKKNSERCVAETMQAFIEEGEMAEAQLRDMCKGLAYGYWALVNGTAGTEGSPRQCLEYGYCGFMFKQYDLSASDVPFSIPTNGLDSQI